MAKIQTSVSVPVTSHADAKAKLKNQLGSMAAKLDKETGDEILLKRGSQAKLRLLGGMFIKDADLPVLASVAFDPSKPQEVSITVSEHLVVGITMGMEDKYQRSCTEFAQLLANAVR
jgi:hypothetical protein